MAGQAIRAAEKCDTGQGSKRGIEPEAGRGADFKAQLLLANSVRGQAFLDDRDFLPVKRIRLTPRCGVCGVRGRQRQ